MRTLFWRALNNWTNDEMNCIFAREAAQAYCCCEISVYSPLSSVESSYLLTPTFAVVRIASEGMTKIK